MVGAAAAVRRDRRWEGRVDCGLEFSLGFCCEVDAAVPTLTPLTAAVLTPLAAAAALGLNKVEVEFLLGGMSL